VSVFTLVNMKGMPGYDKFVHIISKTIEKSMEGENFIFSPYSIHKAFSVAMLASQGKTREELEKVLFLIGEKKDIVEEYELDKILLSRNSNSARLKDYSEIAVSKDFIPKKYFVALVKEIVEVKNYDFDKPQQTVQKINRKVSEQTNNMIPKFLPPNFIYSATKCIILNAMYFKDQWKYPFKKSKDFVFHSNYGDRKLEFLYLPKIDDASYFYYKENKIKVLSLPYREDDISMIFYLPTEKNFENVEKMTDLLQKINLENLRSQPVQPVMIPKFTMEFRIDNLRKIMETMGAKRMWTAKANFNGLSEEKISASEAVHEAKIEVNEGFTQAAEAPTAIKNPKLYVRRPKSFVANRPFLYAIYHKSAGVLFVGKYVKP